MLNITHLSKSFDGHTALSDVSLHVKQGSIFGLLGPNGAGKTTLIRIINQILTPDQGDILIDGCPLSSQHSQTIGYLPEERGLYPKMTIEEQAIYLAQLKGLSKLQAQKRLSEWLTRLDIESWRNRMPSQLSKGMQQKIQFVITLLHQPQLIILDEPFSGLDPVNAEGLKNEIRRLHQQGTTIILSSHNMASIEELCDSIALLSRSHLVLTGNLEEIKSIHSGKSLNDIFIQHVSQ
ncbi:MAG: ATP-binding cassette domain-containing protein [Bacteroidales bacterium]|nr:ATP-binding cassette domain-containing protein [Candidatus Colimorpha onthohippi]